MYVCMYVCMFISYCFLFESEIGSYEDDKSVWVYSHMLRLATWVNAHCYSPKNPSPLQRLRFRFSTMMLYILITQLSERVGGKAVTNTKVRKKRVVKQKQSIQLDRNDDESKRIEEEKAEQESAEAARYNSKKHSIPLHTRLVLLLKLQYKCSSYIQTIHTYIYIQNIHAYIHAYLHICIPSGI
jgi:hypothetical protein